MRSDINYLRKYKDVINDIDLPFEVKQLVDSICVAANILWGEKPVYQHRPYPEPGQHIELRGEEGFITYLDSVAHVFGRSNYAVRRMFKDCPKEWSDPYKTPMKEMDIGKEYSFLATESDILCIVHRTIPKLYCFEAFQLEGHIYYFPSVTAEDEVEVVDVLETLDALRETAAFKDFNEEGKRKVGSLIKYLSDYLAKLEGRDREK